MKFCSLLTVANKYIEKCTFLGLLRTKKKNYSRKIAPKSTAIFPHFAELKRRKWSLKVTGSLKAIGLL